MPKRVLCMNLGKTRLRGRPKNRWQDGVREDGRIVGGEGWQEKRKRGMEEAPENGKESSNSAHDNGMNELFSFNTFVQGIYVYIPEINHVSKVRSVAAVVYLQFVLHVMLCHM